ncbi:MAG TPA: hypothetical protein VLJ59_00110 [Mycobacteriales bacterium]|nr:hypothetical protein [Mycobacteriales bacterium]
MTSTGPSTEGEAISRFEGEEQHGWAPDNTNPTGRAAEADHKAYDASNAGEPGPGREVSAEERAGVSDTDTDGRSALGVGESMTRRAEDIAKESDDSERYTTGTQGPSQRPVGKSTPDDVTGVRSGEAD